MSDQAKRCVGCGVDCSDRPRVKDKNGRYLCRSCYDARKATRPSESDVATKGLPVVDSGAQTGTRPPVADGLDEGYGLASDEPRRAPSAGAPSDADVMANLLAEDLNPGTEQCPECRARIKQGAVICSNCGYNKVTGKAVQTRVLKALEAKESKGSGRTRTLEIPGWVIPTVVAAGYCGLGYYATIDEMAWMAWMVTAGVFFLACYVWGLVAAFQEGETTWGVMGIVGAFCCAPLQLVFIIWSILQTHRPVMSGLMLVNFISYVAALIVGHTTWDSLSQYMEP